MFDLGESELVAGGAGYEGWFVTEGVEMLGFSCGVEVFGLGTGGGRLGAVEDHGG